jgi:uncharacterized protein (UPF0335 family)
MTEQQLAGDGQTSAPARRGKSLKGAIRDEMTKAGLIETAPNQFTVPEGWLERQKAETGEQIGDSALKISEVKGRRTARPKSPPPDHNASDDRLRLLIERIERLEEEKKGIGDDIKDVYSEAKSTGYDPAIMRRVVKLRKMKPDDRREAEALLETYCAWLGMDVQPLLL